MLGVKLQNCPSFCATSQCHPVACGPAPLRARLLCGQGNGEDTGGLGMTEGVVQRLTFPFFFYVHFFSLLILAVVQLAALGCYRPYNDLLSRGKI